MFQSPSAIALLVALMAGGVGGVAWALLVRRGRRKRSPRTEVEAYITQLARQACLGFVGRTGGLPKITVGYEITACFEFPIGDREMVVRAPFRGPSAPASGWLPSRSPTAMTREAGR